MSPVTGCQHSGSINRKLIALLDQYVRNQARTVARLAPAYCLVDEFSRVGIERACGEKLVNLNLGRDRSAVDGTDLDSVSAGVPWPVGRRMDLEFHLGRSRTEGFDSSLCGGLSLIVYGGG